MTTTKKDFGVVGNKFLDVELPKQNTSAEVFEIKPAEEKVEQTPAKTIPAKKELKTKGILLKLTPSLHEKVKLIAEEQGLSINAFITTNLVNIVKHYEW